MSDAAAIADLLHEAGETHHVVYRIVDGDDPDWASWYADWLLDHSELPQLLGTAPGPQPPRPRARRSSTATTRPSRARSAGRTGTPSGCSSASAG